MGPAFEFDADLDRLQHKIERLVALCRLLREENRALKTQREQWSRERSQWVEKTAAASNQVEAMISRLKSMGHES